jgi:integrase
MDVGRRRENDLELPRRMRRKGKAFYYDAGGKPRKWLPLGSDKAIALLKWAEMEGSDQTATVSGLIDKYLASQFYADLKPTTRYSYKRWTLTLKKVFGNMHPADVRPHHIAKFLDSHNGKVLANKGVAVLSTVYEKGMRWGIVDSNPTRGIRRNKTVTRDRYITDAEFLAIRAKAAPILKVVMDIAYLTGMRQGDICKIKREDIKDGALHVIQGKTGKKQAFLLNGALADAVAAAKALPGAIKGLHLLTTRKGTPYTTTTIRWYWRNACVAAGITNAHFHDIRGKAGTDAKAVGIDHQALLGHQNRAMSDRYVKAREVDRVTTLSKRIVEGSTK